MKICLVIIFNHRFDSVIPILRRIYRGRFDTIRFLVPFYEGIDEDVIPVYECSYQYQGYLIQAYEKLIQTKSDYYLFVSDDMIVNSAINQSTLISELNLRGKDVFISGVYPINATNRFDWIHSRYSSKPFLHKATMWKGSIPDKETALRLFSDFLGYEYPVEYLDDFWGSQSDDEKARFIKDNGGDITIPYPMAGGYSDFFILSDKVFYSIARTCGVFAAMNLFVEIAIPTSIVLNVSRDRVVTMDMTDYIKAVFWGDDIESFEVKYGLCLRRLIEQWDEKWLFAHPVKLSKWDISGCFE